MANRKHSKWKYEVHSMPVLVLTVAVMGLEAEPFVER